ncbi:MULTISPECIES: PDDEXK nuclease domain-containing protein [unclassified Methanoculleus]|jgi:predicted nuclease of restriction endonuclease-like (RecB) superfamily|uniref:PDDEXK nuclease domain-containing protein n=1 Tax=unclassified Methanoculleus TaxID=2619537 RepID=UPI0025CD89C0|nr:PDDEXK nuclease domain-containing protein [Methanoculleus sp. UBA377]MDD4567248.1 PDDEXK nuclease domain-containing protein [Methanoculleus chikugoensis]
MGSSEVLPEDYPAFLAGLKVRIREAQTRAVLSANRELILLYWQIGREILHRQEQEGWGTKVIDRLSADLRREFPEMKGFSPRNLKYMRSFAEAWPDPEFVQEVLAQITWYHTVTLLDKVKDPKQREWYIHKTIANGWSRNVLVHQIESGLIEREGRAVTNFSATLPAEQSDLALQTLKDPYVFDFLRMGEKVRESELERALLDHIREFLLELGVGFAFVGSQYRLDVGGQDFYIDLLFYHLKLRSYVVIDLKVGEFIPEYAGKMNFYLSAVDDLLRHPDDNPSIGLVLCKSRNRIIAEYALRDMEKPIGIAGYELTTSLPEDLRDGLPTVDELEEELSRGER